MQGGGDMKSVRELWANRTFRILAIAAAALILLIACWLVFGHESSSSVSGTFPATQEEERLAAVLSEVEDAGNVRVLITQEDGAAVGAVVLFDGMDGILVRLRLTQITAKALNIAENRVLVCPSDMQK